MTKLARTFVFLTVLAVCSISDSQELQAQTVAPPDTVTATAQAGPWWVGFVTGIVVGCLFDDEHCLGFWNDYQEFIAYCESLSGTLATEIVGSAGGLRRELASPLTCELPGGGSLVYD